MADPGVTTRLYLARHGETTWNLERRLQGRGDSPLTPTGMEQARRLAVRLASASIDRIYCSPLGRALETATIVASRLGLTPVTRDALTEIALGPWEGWTHDEARTASPRQFRDFWHDPERFELDGAESFLDLQTRVCEELDALMDSHAGGAVLVVSHWIAIKTALARYLDYPLSRLADIPDLENGSSVLLTRQGTRVHVELQ